MLSADLGAEAPLDLVVVLDDLAELVDLLVGQIVDPLVRDRPGGFADLAGAGTADAVDVGQGDVDVLVREVDSRYTCHAGSSSYLCRCLCFGFSQMIRTTPLPLDDLAFVADRLDARSYLHGFLDTFASATGSSTRIRALCARCPRGGASRRWPSIWDIVSRSTPTRISSDVPPMS